MWRGSKREEIDSLWNIRYLVLVLSIFNIKLWLLLFSDEIIALNKSRNKENKEEEVEMMGEPITDPTPDSLNKKVGYLTSKINMDQRLR